jgi:hypothetical protein
MNSPSVSPSMNSAYSTDYSPSYSSIETTPQGGNFFTNLFSNFDWKIWLLIIFILAFLGFNVFLYLAQGTQTVTNLFAPIASYFGSTTLDATKQIVSTSATGTKAATDIVAGTVNTGLDAVQEAANDIEGATATTAQNAENVLSQQPTVNYNNTLTQALNTNTENSTYTADDSYSSIQMSKSSSKSGWCYIGEDRGFRSCISVGENDTCMSGDIFPSEDVCVNPNLRY